jgi:hypothetical protein
MIQDVLEATTGGAHNEVEDDDDFTQPRRLPPAVFSFANYRPGVMIRRDGHPSLHVP